jgi:hypothetical protein
MGSEGVASGERRSEESTKAVQRTIGKKEDAEK